MLHKCLVQFVAIVLCLSLGVKANRTIIFPEDEDFRKDCALHDKSLGMCRNIKDCSTGTNDRVTPKTCYFERFEQFVCCKDDPDANLTERPATKACALSHPIIEEVVEGQETEPLEFPSMVALGWKIAHQNNFEYKCGGVMIDEFYVLTAAHCAFVNGQEPDVVLSRGGDLNATTSEIHRIEYIRVHPNYKPALSYNDIAIIKLEDGIFNTLPACVWPNFTPRDSKVVALGYGHTVFAGLPSNKLLKAYLSITTNRECNQYYRTDSTVPNGIIDQQICAIDPAKKSDTCQGDSGGPLIMQVPARDDQDDTDYVIGITSFGLGCALKVPGVYTRVSEFIDWIESIVWRY